MKLLIVEDSPQDLEVILRKIEAQCPDEFECHAAVSFEDAVAILSNGQRFDVILLDLAVSEWPRTYEEIRKLDDDIPIIVMTSRDDTAVGEGTIKAGAQDYLVKEHLGEYQLCYSLKFAVERQKHINDARARDRKLATAQAELAEVAASIKEILDQ